MSLRVRRGACAAALALGGLAVSGAGGAAELGAHPLHTTLTEITFAPDTRTVNVSVRIFADDFSAAVARSTGQKQDPAFVVPEAPAIAYVSRTFALADAAGKPLALTWCGMRRSGDLVWICIRANAASLAGLRVRNALQMDLYTDQINIVQGIVDGSRKSVLFTKGDGWKPLG